MAVAGEDLSYEDLKEIVEGLTCRMIPPNVTPELPHGLSDLASLPKDDLESSNKPLVHCFEIIYDHQEDIEFYALGRQYKEACDKQDLQLLPAPLV